MNYNSGGKKGRTVKSRAGSFMKTHNKVKSLLNIFKKTKTPP